MSPQAGVYGKAEVDADIAAHAALPTVHQDAPALILTHKGDASAHHARYTDVEAGAVADALIAIHALLAAAHHDRYTDGEAQDVADTQIATHAGLSAAHHTKTVDASELTAGILALARLSNISNAQIAAGAAIAESKLALDKGTQALFDKIAADIATHAGLATVHQDAPALIATHATGSKHRWTDEKLRKGAGAGADPDEIDVPAAGPTIVRKTSDETVNNSTTLQNDDELLLAIAANEVWAVDIYIKFFNAGTANFKGGIVLPALADCEGGIVYDDLAGTVQWEQTLASGEVATMGGVGENAIVVFHYIVTNGANAGNVQFQWAQVTANAEDTTVRAGSCIIAHQLA